MVMKCENLLGIRSDLYMYIPPGRGGNGAPWVKAMVCPYTSAGVYEKDVAT